MYKSWLRLTLLWRSSYDDLGHRKESEFILMFLFTVIYYKLVIIERFDLKEFLPLINVVSQKDNKVKNVNKHESTCRHLWLNIMDHRCLRRDRYKDIYIKILMTSSLLRTFSKVWRHLYFLFVVRQENAWERR